MQPQYCSQATDCPGLYCCLHYSPAGALDNPRCTVAQDIECSYFLCDPTVSGPCVMPQGKTGTCMYTRLTANDQNYYWACK